MIEQLEAAAAGTSLGFGIRRADKDIEQLKQQVVQDFSRLILAHYDQMLGPDLARGEARLAHPLGAAQRPRLMADCRTSREECARARQSVVSGQGGAITVAQGGRGIIKQKEQERQNG